jgi:DNA-binding transcriptional LysR family regulator
MDINSLNAFVAVAENGSFSLAAEHLHLTQPAVSKRVAQLEAELDTRLFDRIGRRITLTEAGRQLMPRARNLLLEMADIRRDLSNLTGEVGGVLSMATSHHIGLRRLPSVLKRFSRSYPRVQLDIRFMDSETACAEVEHGNLELAIVTLPTDPPTSLTIHPIWEDPLQFVVGDEHPLAREEPPALEHLLEYPAVLTTEGTYTREIVENALRSKGHHARIGMATNYLETLKMMVTIGLGWSLLPETMVHEGGLHPLKFEGLELTRALGAVTHRKRTLSNAAKRMLETCHSHAAEAG